MLMPDETVRKSVMRSVRRMWPVGIALLLWGCGGARKTQVDPVSEAMKQAVAGSAARAEVRGRTDWEVMPSSGEYWVSVRITNKGGAGTVALRAALKAMVPYVGMGVSPTEPMYIQMNAGETVLQRLTGKIPAEISDKAIGCVVEAYPRAERAP